MEAMAPAEIGYSSLRRYLMVKHPELNNMTILARLDDLEEVRNTVLCRIKNYQLAAKYYNKKVHNRHFDVGDLMLRKVFENTA